LALLFQYSGFVAPFAIFVELRFVMGARFRLWLVVVLLAMAALSSPMQEKISAQSAPVGIMISEFRFSAPTFSSDEYIELFNSTSASIDISGWWLKASDNRGVVADRAQFPANMVLGPGCYFLIGGPNYTLSSTAAPDVRYLPGATQIFDDGSVAVFKADKTTIVDQVGFRTASSAATAFFETERLLQTTPVTPGRIYERRPSVFTGFQDTDHNVNDFVLKGTPGPQNKTGPCLQFTTYTPHDIQGPGAVSPLSGAVRVKGVVTARKSDGFFIQTETGFEDSDPNTSEGLFVSANGGSLAAAVVGHLVKVTGGIEEFVPSRTSTDPSFTRIANVLMVEDLGVSSVPAAYPLTSAELSPAGSLAQLERFEGMRVTAPSLTAVSGSDDDAAFFAVLTGQMRPFREPGVQANYPVPTCALAPCHIPVFDGNPERLRVDSDGLELRASVLVSSGAVIASVTGPLEFSAGNYTLLPESLSVAGGMSVVSVAGAGANQFTVASLNLGVFNAARLAKASQAVRHVLNSPDVIGVQGVDTISALSDLATQINSDAGATVYDAIPAGNPDDALGIGFLLKAGRASSLGEPEIVSIRASMALRVHVQGPSTSLPQDVTVLVNQFQSLTNIELNDAVGAAVRTRRRSQAEAVANYIQNRQSSDPSEAIIALGDFNAFDFNDGYVDVLGIVRGVSAPPDQVALASSVVVAPPFGNADALNPAAERYASLSNGNAQSLDHVLVSASLTGANQLLGLAHARVNADFPEAFRADDTAAMRFSDRDPLVAYFAFPADVVAPVIDAVQDVIAEATGADGAVVTFATPAAHDNLDPVVTVSCLPASGSVFAVRNTGVTCSTQDVAGNQSSVSFTVTVQDTTAPVVTVPEDQVAEATSAAGAVVTFSASATDAVTSPLTVGCSPASGSTFALGTTVVTCSAADAVPNVGLASFNVTVRDTTAPVVSVPAVQVAEATSAAGAVVTFNATATDTVTSGLAVLCLPLSGSTFQIGDTLVTCTTVDAANNPGSAFFTVSVVDTTAPVLLLPAHITEEATSAAGRVVTYVASAADLVTPDATATCSPASGSTFPVGDTEVSCSSSSDAAGNSSTGSFTITITPLATNPLVGRMAGAGHVLTGQHTTWFEFDVRGSTDSVERGSVSLMVRDGNNGRPNRFVATSESGLQFTNSEGYEPGRFPRSGIDTVSFNGVGSWNGQSGYRFELTASDRGEPGKGLDTFTVTVFAPNGSVVESASGTLRDGNIQSLR
jgi:predicted extracellular nuclease